MSISSKFKAFKAFLGKGKVSMAINIGYILGWVWSIEFGYFLWYFFITTTLALLLFWKPLIEIMKFGGDVYASFCREKSYKLTKKIYKGYERKDMEDMLKEKNKEYPLKAK